MAAPFPVDIANPVLEMNFQDQTLAGAGSNALEVDPPPYSLTDPLSNPNRELEDEMAAPEISGSEDPIPRSRPEAAEPEAPGSEGPAPVNDEVSAPANEVVQTAVDSVHDSTLPLTPTEAPLSLIANEATSSLIPNVGPLVLSADNNFILPTNSVTLQRQPRASGPRRNTPQSTSSSRAESRTSLRGDAPQSTPSSRAESHTFLPLLSASNTNSSSSSQGLTRLTERVRRHLRMPSRPPPGWTIDGDDSPDPPHVPARPRAPAPTTYPREKRRPVVLAPDTSTSNSSRSSARSTSARNMPTVPQAAMESRTNVTTLSSGYPPRESEATRHVAMPSSSGVDGVLSTAASRPPPEWTDDSPVPPHVPARPRAPTTYPRPVVLAPDTSTSNSSQSPARSTSAWNMPTVPQAAVESRTNATTLSSGYPPRESEATRHAAMPPSSGVAGVLSTAALQTQLPWLERQQMHELTQQMRELTQQMREMAQQMLDMHEAMKQMQSPEEPS